MPKDNSPAPVLLPTPSYSTEGGDHLALRLTKAKGEKNLCVGTDTPKRAAILSLGPGMLLVRLFPGSDVHTVMKEDSALHLLRLLERYNWVLAKHADRWRRFWPALTHMERTMVVMFVCSNNKGGFQGPVCLRPLPPEIADFAGDRTLVKLDTQTAREFMALRHFFVTTLVNVDDIKFRWQQTHQTVLTAFNAIIDTTLHSWWSGNGSVQLSDFLRASLLSVGLSAEDAQHTANEMGLQAMYLIHKCELSSIQKNFD